MYDVNDLPSLPVYEWDRAKKRAFLDAELSDLTDWHAARCPQYARMRDAWPARGEGCPFCRCGCSRSSRSKACLTKPSTAP